MIIAGVDEAGRGSLFGPVVAGAVIMDESFLENEDIKDSKSLSFERREKVFKYICEYAKAISVGVVSNRFIDRYNILVATLEAMKRAVEGLSIRPDIILVDGIHEIPISISQRCIKKGDKLNKLISAASIVAKVYRDRLMFAYHKKYPFYNLAKNKGYPTREHKEMIKRYGPSPFHRLSFKGVKSEK